MPQSKNKVINIADTLHGTILMSTLEHLAISTTAFNRLHNILQNSTVYLTFPSNQTKRFEHSLGVMTLGGKMFYHSIANAEPAVRASFFDVINKEIQIIMKDTAFSERLESKLGDYASECVNNWKTMKLSESFYDFFVPKIISDEQNFAYLVTYQSIRLASLLHDIGHPPFSHITEFALKKVWDIISAKEQKNKREIKFLEATNFYSSVRPAKLHEQIGDRISERLIKSVIHTFPNPSSRDEANTLLFYFIVHEFVTKIFSEKPAIFEDIHRIIASSIDCDRLDYISRDMQNSGIDFGSIEYERLIASMKLMKDEDDYLFCPSIKSLNSIEDFFNRRWLLYQNVIYHHRVIKTDSLLGNAVVNLALDYLQDPNGDAIDAGGSSQTDRTHPTSNSVLPVDISGLWDAVKETVFNKEYFNALIQWDDSWLLTVLRREFFTNYISKDNRIRYQLDELLSNKKFYRSMIKKMDAFQQLDKIVAENFTLDFENVKRQVKDYVIPEIIKLQQCKGQLESTLGKLQEHIESMYDTVGKIDLGVQGELAASVDSIVADHREMHREFRLLFSALEERQDGFFMWTLKQAYLKLYKLNTKKFEKLFEDTIESIICSVAEERFQVKDCMVVFSKNKTGLEDNLPYVHHDDQIISITEVSRIHTELGRKASFSPLFYIYVHEHRIQINDKEFLEEVGKKLGQELALMFAQEAANQTELVME